MWNAINGSYAISQPQGTPTWVAVGQTSSYQNACTSSFIQNSQTWIVQFENYNLNPFDQDYGC